MWYSVQIFLFDFITVKHDNFNLFNIDRRYTSTQNICYSEKKKIMFIPYIVSVENIFSLKTSIAVLTGTHNLRCMVIGSHGDVM